MSDAEPEDDVEVDRDDAGGVDPESPARAVIDEDSEDLPEPSEPG
jgi:hypothetical protein